MFRNEEKLCLGGAKFELGLCLSSSSSSSSVIGEAAGRHAALLREALSSRSYFTIQPEKTREATSFLKIFCLLSQGCYNKLDTTITIQMPPNCIVNVVSDLL